MKQKEKIPVAQQGIEARLINWGLCQRGRGGGSMRAKQTRSGHGGGGYQCMTDAVCNMLRIAATGPKGSAASQAQLDFTDSKCIQDAWQRLPPRPRLLLRDLYALGRPVNVICRELSIKHWPAIHWQRELARAQEAIDDLVRSGNK